MSGAPKVTFAPLRIDMLLQNFLANANNEHQEASYIDAEETASIASDSGYSLNDSNYTASLTSSIKDYKYENGRRYHSFRAGEYILPNDEEEQDRMDLAHHIYRLILGGGLYRAPIPDNVQRVLDLGTGTGIVRTTTHKTLPNSQHPSAEVIGNDLSPIQPAWYLPLLPLLSLPSPKLTKPPLRIPPNCRFEIDDIESPWSFSHKFDFIHGRELEGMLKDPQRLFAQAFANLTPHGFLEMQSIELDFFSDDGTHTRATNCLRWRDLQHKAAETFGKSMTTIRTWEDKLRAVGFVDVRREVYKVPLNHWPKDRKMKELGKYQQLQMWHGLSSYTMAPFTRVLGWSPEEIEVLLAGLRKEIQDTSIHMYAKFHFVYGRKPGEGEIAGGGEGEGGGRAES
ncbi:hypothetical protein PRK78_002798 [Emydomyces testavorans]|uniref:S-adenosyl-L-methionine-dependent methyltransferase n=1 Tax=Emydomyces testavorans TaxID=2070801 RepID=A0AAF0DFN1_9EURO|nr:hypothetical protein PRK78_002798 [Emydomyces testavorans]